METININGKEYTESHFIKDAGLKDFFYYKNDIKDFFHTMKEHFPRHEAEPPKLRPMSELPATKNTCVTFCNFLVEHNSGNRYYMNGHYFKSEAAGTYACIGDDTPKPLQGWIFGEYKLLGWLYELPNPNDIKL